MSELTNLQRQALDRLTRGAYTINSGRPGITVTSEQVLPQELIDQFTEKNPHLTVLTLERRKGGQQIKVALRDNLP